MDGSFYNGRFLLLCRPVTLYVDNRFSEKGIFVTLK
jgi:hypothetical protein